MQSDKSSSSSCPLVPSLAEHTFANLEQLQQENVFIFPLAPLLIRLYTANVFPAPPVLLIALLEFKMPDEISSGISTLKPIHAQLRSEEHTSELQSRFD